MGTRSYKRENQENWVQLRNSWDFGSDKLSIQSSVIMLKLNELGDVRFGTLDLGDVSFGKHKFS